MHKIVIIVHLLLLSYAIPHRSLPLSTRSRWIIDDAAGARMKLTCVNWAAHLEPMLAEGLDKKPMGDIAKNITTMGFNCVRLTWATYMFTRHVNLTVAQSFRQLGLQDAMEGIAHNNPDFLKFTVIEAQGAVIHELGLHGVMVVLDNQVSQPMWCCGDHDGNGFFGDRYFDPKEWQQGLDIVAKRYKDTPMVVAMSMRNELRGARQNENLWYQYMQSGARTIHRANPNVLVIVSGLHYDIDFTFLKKRPFRISFKNKLVYEAHRYAFTSAEAKLWLQQPFDQVCESLIHTIQTQAGFLVEGENPAPLFISEFGINQERESRAESLFLDCFLSYLAKMDLDWAVWALQGSYYLRKGQHGLDETYGMLDSNWSTLRNPQFHQKLQFIRQEIRDPKSKRPSYYILYHPSSGHCIEAHYSHVFPTNCRSFSRWNHDRSNNSIRLMGSKLCLSVIGDGIPAYLSDDCTSSESQWDTISNTKFRVAHKDKNGTYLCLDWEPDNPRILTKICQENSSNQRFKLILANAQ